MVILQQGNKIEPKVLDNLHLKTIYNFTYRLSGNRDVAEILTEKVLLKKYAKHHYDDVIMLKQAWEDFLVYYGRFAFKEEGIVQQKVLSLPPEPRCAIILRDILGYSYRQIAKILNKSDVSVGILVSLARQELVKKHCKCSICKKSNNSSEEG